MFLLLGREKNVMYSKLMNNPFKYMIFFFALGFITNFEYTTFFSCLIERNIFYERSISIKQLWIEIIEKIGCSKSVRPSTVVYIIYITWTYFEHHFSQLFRVRFVLSRWTFFKIYFFRWDTRVIIFKFDEIPSRLIKNSMYWRYYRKTDTQTSCIEYVFLLVMQKNKNT